MHAIDKRFFRTKYQFDYLSLLKRGNQGHINYSRAPALMNSITESKLINFLNDHYLKDNQCTFVWMMDCDTKLLKLVISDKSELHGAYSLALSKTKYIAIQKLFSHYLHNTNSTDVLCDIHNQGYNFDLSSIGKINDLIIANLNQKKINADSFVNCSSQLLVGDRGYLFLRAITSLYGGQYLQLITQSEYARDALADFSKLSFYKGSLFNLASMAIDINSFICKENKTPISKQIPHNDSQQEGHLF